MVTGRRVWGGGTRRFWSSPPCRRCSSPPCRRNRPATVRWRWGRRNTAPRPGSRRATRPESGPMTPAGRLVRHRPRPPVPFPRAARWPAPAAPVAGPPPPTTAALLRRGIPGPAPRPRPPGPGGAVPPAQPPPTRGTRPPRCQRTRGPRANGPGAGRGSWPVTGASAPRAGRSRTTCWRSRRRAPRRLPATTGERRTRACPRTRSSWSTTCPRRTRRSSLSSPRSTSTPPPASTTPPSRPSPSSSTSATSSTGGA